MTSVVAIWPPEPPTDEWFQGSCDGCERTVYIDTDSIKAAQLFSVIECSERFYNVCLPCALRLA